MTPRPILLTGFEPFGGDTLNASWEAVRALDGWRTGDVVVHGRCLPCVFGDALAELDRLIDALKPQLVIAVGEAGGRADITPERVAINIDDARIACNAGREPIDRPVIEGGPPAYFSTLPIKAIVRELRAAGIPASVSNSAGTFVCNHLFYGLMHRLAQRGPGGPADARGGFVHVPWLPEQAKRQGEVPGVPREVTTEALRIAITTTLANPQDVRERFGALN